MQDDTASGAQTERTAHQARDWIVRLASGDASEREVAEFKAWRDADPAHAAAFARESAFWRALDGLEPPAASVRRRQPVQPGRRALLLGGGVLATAAAAFVLAPRLSLLVRADHRTQPGEQARVVLPDGSVAFLNTDTALSVAFGPGRRVAGLLQGEALFEVAAQPAAPFEIAALGGSTETAAAHVAVRALDGMTTVTVTSGQARVFGAAAHDAAGAARFVSLLSDQMTHYAAGGLPADPVQADPDAATAWREGRVIFDNKPFVAALAELARYVTEPVVLASRGHAQERVSAILSIRQAPAAIDALAQTQGLAVRRIPYVVTVVG